VALRPRLGARPDLGHFAGRRKRRHPTPATWAGGGSPTARTKPASASGVPSASITPALLLATARCRRARQPIDEGPETHPLHRPAHHRPDPLPQGGRRPAERRRPWVSTSMPFRTTSKRAVVNVVRRYVRLSALGQRPAAAHVVAKWS
jgi:hypothetical protein